MTAVLPPGVLVAGLAGLGLLIGSFLNVVAYRVPLGLSVVAPPSSCPSCSHPIRARDNVPVLSWLLLRGRCRDCAVPVSARYPAVELLTGALFALLGWRYGATPVLAALLFVAATGVVLALVDLDHRRLPFGITVPATAVTVVLLAVDGVVNGWGPATTAGLSAAVWVAVYGGIWVASAGRGMGLGDVVLAPLLGLLLGWLGWGPALVGLMAGFWVGAATGAVLLLVRRAGRRSRLPHGPAMLAGAAVGTFLGEPVWTGYLTVTGLA